jgi:hypothetical protein
MPPKKRVKKVLVDESDGENLENSLPNSTAAASKRPKKSSKLMKPVECIELSSSDTENDENACPKAVSAINSHSKLTRACKRTISVRKSLELNSNIDSDQEPSDPKSNTQSKVSSRVLTSSSLVNQPLVSLGKQAKSSQESSNLDVESKPKKTAHKTLSNKNSKSKSSINGRLNEENDEEPMGKKTKLSISFM